MQNFQFSRNRIIFLVVQKVSNEQIVFHHALPFDNNHVQKKRHTHIQMKTVTLENGYMINNKRNKNHMAMDVINSRNNNLSIEDTLAMEFFMEQELYTN